MPYLTQLLEGRPPVVIGEAARCHFNHAYAEGPDVRSDVVLSRITLRIDAFRCHIRLAAGINGLGNGVHEVA